MTGRPALRRSLRQLRQTVPPVLRRRHAHHCARHALGLRWLRAARRIALYWPVRAEADPRPLLRRLLQLARRVFLPLTCGARLRFAPYTKHCMLRRGRFGIPQPRQRQRALAASQLDLIITPLLGVDARGTRLGSGGGWYDRSLAFRLRRCHWRRPRIVGLAYGVQRCPPLVREPWDVPLDALITEEGVTVFAPDGGAHG